MTNKEKQIIEEFEKEFGQYAILGSLGRVYNGGFDNDARISKAQDFILKALKSQRKEIVEEIEIGIDEIFSKRKEVCTCPKGGMYGDEVCSDCGGTEWALSKELKEIGQEIKNLIKEDETL